jgi:hypothetical protein
MNKALYNQFIVLLTSRLLQTNRRGQQQMALTTSSEGQYHLPETTTTHRALTIQDKLTKPTKIRQVTGKMPV